MKLKDAANSHAKRTDAKQKAAQLLNTKQKNVVNDIDVIKARNRVLADQAGVPHALAEPGAVQPDPLLLVALHASRPHLLSLDDLLACRCVCKHWRQRLGTAFCHTVRIPHSLWSEPAYTRFAACISSAAATYQQATDLILDAGGSRPGLQPTLWSPLMMSINPWLQRSSGTVGSAQKQSKGGTDRTNRAAKKCIHLHLQAPASPQRLEALGQVQQLSHMRVQHTNQSLYTRHLIALAGLTQLQSLVLILTHPRLDLRSLAHQRARRVPLKMDCLSSLQQLTQLELTSRGPTGELLPDTIAAFSTRASLAALTSLRRLGLGEAALPGPEPATKWLQPLAALQQLQLVQLDEPGKGQRRGRSTAGSSTCGTAALGAASNAAGLLCGGGFGALAAAAAGRSGVATAEQLQALQQQRQQLQALLPGLQSQLQSQQPYSGRLSSSMSAAAAAGAVNGNAGQPPPLGTQPPARTSSTGSGSDADSGAAAVDLPSLPPLDLSTMTTLTSLHVANLSGERLVGLKIPNQLSKLALHLANPWPGAVTGEQLAAVVLQSSQTLVSLELGLGMRFSLSGGVMRSLKRGLKGLKDLTLFEGTQDHLEGLGCWCNLRRLELIEGRCSVPLRGLYELSMRAAMGRTPHVLRYCGHVRHIEELAGRLGSALHELRLDSVTGLGVISRPTLSSVGSGGSDQLDDSCTSSPGCCSTSSMGEHPDDRPAAPPLAQLVSLTRLEIHGDKLGVLDGITAVALGGLKQLAVLEIIGQEAWLAPELGVKEQLSFLKSLTKLRQLRLIGVMVGRSKLAGTNISSAAAATLSTAQGDKSASNTGKGSSGKSSGAMMPTVKGLGNGLASSTSSTSSSKAGSGVAAAHSVPHVMAAAAAGMVLDSAAAAARDLAVSISLEELRRWLCQLLPCCRVWLD